MYLPNSLEMFNERTVIDYKKLKRLMFVFLFSGTIPTIAEKKIIFET